MNEDTNSKIKQIVNAKDVLELSDFIELQKLVNQYLPQKPIYINEYLRYGSRENHSYLGEVRLTYKEALDDAINHVEHRGGKYDVEIHQVWPSSNVIDLYRKYSNGDER